MKDAIPNGGYKLRFLSNQTSCYSDAEVRLLMLLLDRWSEGGWFPSLTKLAKQTGWDERKVRKVRDSLVAKGAISFSAGTGRTNSDYQLLVVEAWWKARGDDTTAPSGVYLRVEGAPVSPPVSLPESNQLSTEQDRALKAARIRQLLRSLPDDLGQTAKAFQQIPSKPGCDLEKLIPRILDAAQRCGAKAVDDLYRLVAGEKGRMPAWQLYRMLENMRPYSDKTQAAGSDTPPPPAEDDVFQKARHIVERAHESYQGQMEVQNRIRAGGGVMESGWWYDRRLWIARELARVTATEAGDMP